MSREAGEALAAAKRLHEFLDTLFNAREEGEINPSHQELEELRREIQDVALDVYLAQRSLARRCADWFLCHVVQAHRWMRLDDHPMHHICPLCKRECMDWVW